MDFYSRREVAVALISEYGITPVSRCIALNRLFREQGWIVIKEELGRELLDYGQSPVFAVADHQIAHVYVKDPAMLSRVQAFLRQVEGVAAAVSRNEATGMGLNHPRSGDIIVVAGSDAWFSYYYWFDDSKAPDFARCVDIHRKPGYDPAELFLDPELRFPQLRVAWRLLQKKLGFRMLMDVIPLEGGLVRGSHGARPLDAVDFPILVLPGQPLMPGSISSTEVHRWLLSFCKGEKGSR